MKLWLLRPIYDGKGSAWDPWYDKAFGFVVRAEDELKARKLASANGGDENRKKGKRPWLDPKQSACVELTLDGGPGVVIADCHSA
jgi:hypothetical protein